MLRVFARVPNLKRRLGSICGVIAATVIAIALMQSLSRTMDYHQVIHVLLAMKPLPLTGAVAATVLSYAALLGRDSVILRFIGVRVNRPALVVGAFCGSALGNIAGFGPLSGGAVRLRVYGAMGVGGRQVASLMAWITISFGIGLVIFAAASASISPGSVAAMFGVPTLIVRLVCAGILGIGGVGVWLCRPGPLVAVFGRRKIQIRMPTRGFAAVQMGLVAADLLAAGAAMWILLPAGGTDFMAFEAIFAVATALGVLSHVPGGLGVFEAVVVFAVGKSIPTSQVMATLIAYRLIYFFLPLLLSAGLLAAFELRGLPAQMSSPAMLRIRRTSGQLAPLILGVVTFTIGIMLMLSGATPAFTRRLTILAMTFPLWVVESSQFFGSLLGVVLLFVARGLVARLDGAWWMALTIAMTSLVLSLLKGLAFGEAGILLCLVLLLVATRRRFDRSAWLLGETFTPEWYVAIAAVIAVTFGIFFFAFRDVPYSHELWWEFAFDAKAPRALRATLAATLLAGGIAFWQMLRLAPGRVSPPTAVDIDAAAAIIAAQERSDVALALMGDKCFLFNQARSAFLMYAKRSRSWVALYDPVGPVTEWRGLIRDFVALAHQHGGRAAFYQVRRETISLYLDAGLHLMKLGEEAWIELDEFDLVGSHRSHLRYALKRGSRDGLAFIEHAPAEVGSVMADLQTISDGWLRSHNAHEKGFSVAGFVPRFVTAQSAVVVSQHGQPVAFATYMSNAQRSEATIGVMRYLPEASAYAMEFLFTQLALSLKQAGFRRLSLGVAPLSGLACTPLSSTWHRVGSMIWQHGGAVYDFQGLRRFKNKFAPHWEPRYLAATGTVGPFVVLADVVALTGTRTELTPWAA